AARTAGFPSVNLSLCSRLLAVADVRRIVAGIASVHPLRTDFSGLREAMDDHYRFDQRFTARMSFSAGSSPQPPRRSPWPLIRVVARHHRTKSNDTSLHLRLDPHKRLREGEPIARREKFVDVGR